MPLVPSPAVAKAAELLRRLADAPTQRFSVSELARETGLPRATCDTLLLALADAGLVRRDARRRYELGAACIVLGDAARVANPALRAAAHHAEALAHALQAFTLVFVRDGAELRVADVFDAGPPLGLRARVGETIPLVPPFGAALVAWSDAEEVDRWLARADPPLDAHEQRRYREALDATRRRGYSVTVVTPRQPDLVGALERLTEHRRADDARAARDEAVRWMAHSEYLTVDLDPAGTRRVAQLSAPVLGADGQVAAAVMLLGPNHELTGDAVAAIGAEVARAAAAATAESGGAHREPTSARAAP